MLPENSTTKAGERDESQKGQALQAADSKEETHTHVPNAHASGLGAMGRNDEKLPTSPDNTDDRPEPAY